MTARAAATSVMVILAERLTRDYGSGFSHSGLTRMAKFYDCVPEEPIAATLSQQLSWSSLAPQHAHDLTKQHVKGLAEVHLRRTRQRFLCSDVHVQDPVRYVLH